MRRKKNSYENCCSGLIYSLFINCTNPGVFLEFCFITWSLNPTIRLSNCCIIVTVFFIIVHFNVSEKVFFFVCFSIFCIAFIIELRTKQTEDSYILHLSKESINIFLVFNPHSVMLNDIVELMLLVLGPSPASLSDKLTLLYSCCI